MSDIAFLGNRPGTAAALCYSFNQRTDLGAKPLQLRVLTSRVSSRGTVVLTLRGYHPQKRDIQFSRGRWQVCELLGQHHARHVYFPFAHEEAGLLLLTQSGREDWNEVAQEEPTLSVQNSGTGVSGSPSPPSQM